MIKLMMEKRNENDREFTLERLTVKRFLKGWKVYIEDFV